MRIPLKRSSPAHELLDDVLRRSAMNVAHLRLRENERKCEARIKSAINKGKQTSWPSQSKGIKLSKFEHNGKDGPLVVFAEELSYPFGNFGNYKVVRQYKPNRKVYSAELASKVTLSEPSKAKASKQKKGLMLNGKAGPDAADSLCEGSGIDVHNSFQTELKLPRLQSGLTRQEERGRSGNYIIGETMSNLECSKNTELPKLPAQEYIEKFRKDAADFERSLTNVGRGNKERRLLKGRTRESMLPKIDERSALNQTNSDRFFMKDDHFRLPKLQHGKDAESTEAVRKKKRKTRPGEQNWQKKTTNNLESRRSVSYNERKAAAQKEQAKWCKMTMQSGSYI